MGMNEPIIVCGREFRPEVVEHLKELSGQQPPPTGNVNGWPTPARLGHLREVVGLARLLIRNEVHCANLASKVLSLALARLAPCRNGPPACYTRPRNW